MSIGIKHCRRLGIALLALATTGFGGCALPSQDGKLLPLSNNNNTAVTRGNHSSRTEEKVNATEQLGTLSESLEATDITEIRELLDAGANVNVRNKYELTPLHVASLICHTKIVKLLLAAKADANAERQNGVTPLWIASLKGHRQIVTLLLAAHADVNAEKEDGVTPLFIASQGATRRS